MKSSEEKKEKAQIDVKKLYSELPSHIGIGLPISGEGMKIEVSSSENEISWYELAKGVWGRKLTKMIVFSIAFILVFNFYLLRYDDWTGGCHIGMQFSLLDWNNLEVKRAIGYIRDNSPADYRKVCDNVDCVELYLPCSFSAGGCFRDDAPRDIGIYTMIRDDKDQPSYTAAIIIHETCHAIQAKERRTSGDRETECYLEHQRFLNEVGVRNIFPEIK